MVLHRCHEGILCPSSFDSSQDEDDLQLTKFRVNTLATVHVEWAKLAYFSNIIFSDFVKSSVFKW